MRYLMLVCGDPEAEKYVPEEDNIGEWVEEMDRRKVRILGNRLKGVKDAIGVRRRKGEVLVTDGPFAETREWIGGFDLLECADRDEAVEIAAKHPMARFGRTEIRPTAESRRGACACPFGGAAPVERFGDGHAASLDDIDRLNAWFGGYALTLREIRHIAPLVRGRSFVVVDVGGGR